MRVDDTWYGWIPTNLGKIVFGFIDERNLGFLSKRYEFKKGNDEISINLFDIHFISDTSFFNKLISFSTREHYSNASILIQNKSNNLDGIIKLFYKDTIFEVSFNIEINGKAKFKLEKIDNFQNINNTDKVSYEIKQIIYVILKSIIHGDNHHHQKIDTILRITENSFDAEKILDYMLLHLKTIERNVKMSKEKCSYRLKHNITLDEVNGYISYMNTFVILFGNDRMKEKLKIANNIKNSLNANVSRKEKKHNFTNTFETTLLTICALIIATNILINTTFDFGHLGLEDVNMSINTTLKHLNLKEININRFYIFIATIIFWFLVYAFVILCDFKSWLFVYHYRPYRFLQILNTFLKWILIILFTNRVSIISGIALIIYGLFILITKYFI